MRTPWKILSDLRLRRRTRTDDVELPADAEVKALGFQLESNDRAPASEPASEPREADVHSEVAFVPDPGLGGGANVHEHVAGGADTEQAVGKAAVETEVPPPAVEQDTDPVISLIEKPEHELEVTRDELLSSVALQAEIQDPVDLSAEVDGVGGQLGPLQVATLPAHQEARRVDDNVVDSVSTSARRVRRKVTKDKATPVEEPIPEPRSLAAEMAELDDEIVELRRRLSEKLRAQNDHLRKLVERFD